MSKDNQAKMLTLYDVGHTKGFGALAVQQALNCGFTKGQVLAELKQKGIRAEVTPAGTGWNGKGIIYAWSDLKAGKILRREKSAIGAAGLPIDAEGFFARYMADEEAGGACSIAVDVIRELGGSPQEDY